MIDKATRKQLAERKEQVRRRINTKVDPENYEFIPATVDDNLVLMKNKCVCKKDIMKFYCSRKVRRSDR